MEKISHVDENDNIIGEITREQANSQGLLHREAYTYLINSKNQVLLQRRADNGRWDHSAAGHFPPSETYLQGAKREFLEELGIDIPTSEFENWGVFLSTSPNGCPQKRFWEAIF